MKRAITLILFLAIAIAARAQQTHVDEISFDAPERKGETVTIDSGYVREGRNVVSALLDLTTV